MADVALAVLVSGSGTILEAIIDRGITVSLVVSDRACRAIAVAQAAGVTAVVLDRALYGGFTNQFDRAAYSSALADVVADVDVVAMAGFGTVVTAEFHDRFEGCVLNTHPSLLPDFKGWHAVRDALAAGVTTSGCTVHVATLALDDGPILAQRAVAIESSDDESSLHERIKAVERDLYPTVIEAVMAAVARAEPPESVRVV